MQLRAKSPSFFCIFNRYFFFFWLIVFLPYTWLYQIFLCSMRQSFYLFFKFIWIRKFSIIIWWSLFICQFLKICSWLVIKIILIILYILYHMYFSNSKIVYLVLIFAFISNKNPLPRFFIQFLSFFFWNMYPSIKAHNFKIAQIWVFPL